MINGKIASSILRSNTVLHGTAVKKPDRMTRILKSNALGRVCEAADNNPVLTNSLFSLAICCFARPITNYLTTPDKKDAAYASGHSISSGGIGAAWSFAIMTPIAGAVGVILKKPQKYLKPSMIKKLFPTVGIEEVMENGKKIQRVMTNAKGNMIRKDGTEILRDMSPLKMNNSEAVGRLKEIEEKLGKTKKQSKIDKLNEEKASLLEKIEEFKAEKVKFEQENPNLYVDSNGVVRSRTVFKTKDGKFQLDSDGSRAASGKKGDKIGCVVQKDKTPITEEIENGAQKEENLKTIFKWVPDTLLAVPRAYLTIIAIPPVLKVLGLKKTQKGGEAQKTNVAGQSNNTIVLAAKAQAAQKNAMPVATTTMEKRNVFANIQSHIALTHKKGGN